MDPLTALAIGSSAASFGSGFFAPEGQQLQGFTGQRTVNDPFRGEARTVRLDPEGTLAEALGQTRSLFEQFGQRAMEPVTMENALPSAFVQQPATFSGGGLPFDVGVTAFDPANPFFTPTAPPGGFSPAAQALLSGLQSGQQSRNRFSLGDQIGGFGIDDSQEFEPPLEGPGSGEQPQASFTMNDPFPFEVISGPAAQNPTAGIGQLPPVTGGVGGQEPGGGSGRAPMPPVIDPNAIGGIGGGDPRFQGPPQTSVGGSVSFPQGNSFLDSLGALDPNILALINRGKVPS